MFAIISVDYTDLFLFNSSMELTAPQRHFLKSLEKSKRLFVQSKNQNVLFAIEKGYADWFVPPNEYYPNTGIVCITESGKNKLKEDLILLNGPSDNRCEEPQCKCCDGSCMVCKQFDLTH